jgi:hypothetical protein
MLFELVAVVEADELEFVLHGSQRNTSRAKRRRRVVADDPVLDAAYAARRQPHRTADNDDIRFSTYVRGTLMGTPVTRWISFSTVAAWKVAHTAWPVIMAWKAMLPSSPRIFR